MDFEQRDGPEPESLSAARPESELSWSEVALPPAEKTKIALPAVLFLITFLTTLAAGFLFHISFVSQNSDEVWARLTRVLTNPMDLLYGFPFCFSILTILLAHEMGHYLTCRYYGIKATLPYVIPAPPPINPFGTFGAVIRIKSNFHDRRQLFDVGIAGPLAGIVFVIPALIIGLQNSKEFVYTEELGGVLEFGEPLLFQLAAKVFFAGGEGSQISLHPVGWAAWFGMLATSINLLPIGQLDGGHVVYAIFGPRGHRIISIATFAGLVALSLYSAPMMGYLIFALILLFLGFRHPRPNVEFIRLNRWRLAVALIGMIIFILTFIPIPVRLAENFGSL